MIRHLKMLCCLLLIAMVNGCELNSPGNGILPIGGRNAEVVTWISGQQWFPATIGILVNDEAVNSYIYLEASSSTNKGYRRILRLNIIDSTRNWLPLEPIDLLETDAPIRVSARYEQFRDKSNRNASVWLADQNSRGGLKITSIETEDGVTYAAGEFFMSPYNFNQRADVQEIEGLFNNIRVFETRAAMDEYFQRINALEAAAN